MTRKRKTLPKDFEATLTGGDLDALKKVFDVCELNAYGSLWKCTALAFDECPDELTRWLVDQGLDVDSPDARGRTPLWHRARAGQDLTLLLELGADVNGGRGESPVIAAIAHPEALRLLLERGAEVNTVTSGGAPLHRAALRSAQSTRILLDHGADPTILDWGGQTPLQAALHNCRNIEIPCVATTARMLLDAGCPIPVDAVEMVTRIGEQFEFHRAGFNPRYGEETDAALSDLYSVFGFPPVARRVIHDGSSPITVDSTDPDTQFDELWNLLVPSNGSAKTVQGEVIRLAGRIARELLHNGGTNWDRGFRQMKDALFTHLGSATPVGTTTERAELSGNITRDSYNDAAIRRVTELAVAWVLANPHPRELAEPKCHQ
jgi:ankyrin repeat protein